MASSWVSLIAFVVATAAMLQCIAAVTYKVGDSTGWTIPPSNGAQFYANWASGKTFAVGDVLSFVFTSAHDVANVTKANFDACSTTATPSKTSPHEFTLTAAGEYYFFCTVGSHCSLGQKLSINVGSTAGPPGSAPTPTGSPGSEPTPSAGSTPPPPSSASSMGAGFGGLVAVLTAFFL